MIDAVVYQMPTQYNSFSKSNSANASCPVIPVINANV